MCWTGDDTAIRKIAERDFYVYKIGKIVGNNIFISDIRGYAPKCLNRIVPLVTYSLGVGNYRIDKGYHSYKDITMPYSGLRSYYRTIYLGKIAEDIRLNNIYSIATFIIPKGSEYYENRAGEIVSSSILYTGKYIKL